MTRIAGLVAAAMAVAAASVAAAPKFTSVWKTPQAYDVTLAGKKIAALVITKDDAVRMSGEEALARELTARGFQAIATYRSVPKEEAAVPERAKAWFERLGVEGVVALRPLVVDRRVTYAESTWVSESYSSLWSYYGYGWTAVYVPAHVDRNTLVMVETTIYSVPRNALLWAAVTETHNPDHIGAFVEELAAGCVKELHKVGLAKYVKK
jgi:hypothetical protein